MDIYSSHNKPFNVLCSTVIENANTIGKHALSEGELRKLLTPEKIQLMITGVKGSCSPMDSKMEQLTMFFLHLCDSGISNEQLRKELAALDPKDFAEIYAYLGKEGKNGVEVVWENPRILLDMVEGEQNIFLALLQHLREGTRPQKEDFHMVAAHDLLIHDIDFLKRTYYEAVACAIHESSWHYSHEHPLVQEDQQIAIAVAKKRASCKETTISYDIHRYRIQDEAARIEIAKIAAAQDGGEISKYIQNYGIQDEAALIEIAKIIAVQDGGEISKYIQNYGIQDEAALIEIAEIAAAQYGKGTSRYIRNYGIQDQSVLVKIAEIAAKECEDLLLEVWNYYLGEAEEIDTFISLFENVIAIGLCKEIIKKENWEDHLASIPAEQSVKRRIVKKALLMYKEKMVGSSPAIDEIFSEIAVYRNFSLAIFLAGVVCEKIAKDSGFLERVKKLATSKPLILPMIFLSKWEKESPAALSSIQGLLQKNKLILKDEKKPLLQSLLLTMQMLDQEPSIPPEKKIALIQGSLEEKNPLQCLSLIQSLLGSNCAEELNQEFEKNQMVEKLSMIFESVLQEDAFLELKLVDNLVDKYHKTLGDMRVPNAWKIYENGLKFPIDTELQREFNRFILSVLEGTHKKERYRVDNSPHLQLIQKEYKECYEKWQQEAPKEPVTQDGKDLIVVDTDDWQDLFLSGTEVSGSCQRIDASVSTNQCLLAYVMDGKNRMIAVKDPSGKIIARCIFRLLWDPVAKKPALFQDRIYPSPLSPALQTVLNKYASKRAVDLGLDLYTCNEREDFLPVEGTLQSLGSSSPYEYEDGVGGIQPKGVFEIKELRKGPSH